MARRFGMDELVGNLLAEWPHEIAIHLQKRDVLVVRASGQGVDLNSVGAPVAKKNLQSAKWQLARHELLHEWFLVHSRFPALAHLCVKSIDDRLRLRAGIFPTSIDFDGHRPPRRYATNQHHSALTRRREEDKA